MYYEVLYENRVLLNMAEQKAPPSNRGIKKWRESEQRSFYKWSPLYESQLYHQII